MTSENSSRGFSLFTPLVGTTLVIMAIMIATGMIQNDVRMSRSITASYEVSSQSLVAKMIKAATIIEMLSKMEGTTYEEATLPFVCQSDGECTDEINARFEGTGKLRNPSISWELVGRRQLFLDLADSIYMILEGSGTNYVLDENSGVLQNRLSDAVDSLDAPFELGHKDGKYYIKLNSSSFKAHQGDFVISFKDSSNNRMDVGIVPETLGITTKEPLYDLINAAKNVYFGDNYNSVSLEHDLDEEFSGKEDYVASVRFREMNPKRLEIDLRKGGRDDRQFTVTFEDSGEGWDFYYTCFYRENNFKCTFI